MAQSISQGDFEDYAAGTQMLVRVRSGEVKLGDHPNTAQRQIASYTPSNGWVSWTPTHAERLVVYAVQDSEVDVQYNDGFSISLFGLPILEVDSDNPNQPVDRTRTERIPAEGVVEVNADITGGVSDGTIKSTVNADANEVWELKKCEVFKPSAESNNGSGDSLTIQTEAQGIELSQGSVDNPVAEYRYRSGRWESENTSFSSRGSGFDEKGTRIDDTNGLEAVYTIDTDTQSNDIEISYQFDVVKA